MKPFDFDVDPVTPLPKSTEDEQPAEASWSRSEDDDLLKELYALMGDAPKEREPEKQPPAPKEEAPEEEDILKKADAFIEDKTPAAQELPTEGAIEESSYDEDFPEEIEEERSAPGWLKGVFLLLVSILLCGMTLYAVAAGVLPSLF